jgi:hypothetical protein
MLAPKKSMRPKRRPKNLGESGSEKAFRILSESGFVSDADKLKMKKKMRGDMESPTPPSQTPQPKPPSRQNGQKPRSGELNKPLSDKDIKYLDQMMQRHMAKGMAKGGNEDKYNEVEKKAYGGKMKTVKKMGSGGSTCRGMGAAKRGGKFVKG